MSKPTPSDNTRCESRSPIARNDVAPRQCRDEQGHAGDHWAKTSDGADVDQRFDYIERWNDEGRFTS